MKKNKILWIEFCMLFVKTNEGLLNIGQEPIDIDTFMLKFSDLVNNVP